MNEDKDLMRKIMLQLRDEIADTLSEELFDKDRIARLIDNYAKLCYMVLNGEWLEDETS